MKIALILGEFCSSHRPLDYNTLATNPRGASGSDWGISRVAQEIAKQGHEVSLFTTHEPNKPDAWEGIRLYHLSEKASTITSDYDAVISWSEPDTFRELPADIVRLCSQQLNGFSYCQFGFDDFVDIWASPSLGHFNFHALQAPTPSKWIIIPDGCDPELYSFDKKVRGRVVYTSSPDRGSHWLLQEWQNIKKQVPEANLRVFYHLSQGDTENFEKGYTEAALDIMEVGQRIRYMKHAMKKLSKMDVEWVGSVSRNRMVDELNEAMVFGYPASVVSAFCEGFSCSTMEACAAGCVPVISDCDAMGELYGNGDIVPMIKSPVQNNMREFTELVVRGLRDEKWIKEITEKCRELASKYTWKLAADKYIDAIKRSPKYKGAK